MFKTYASRSQLIVKSSELTKEESAILDLFKDSKTTSLDNVPKRMANKALHSLMGKGYVRSANHDTLILIKNADKTPAEVEMEHRPTFDKIRKDVKEDGKLDMSDKDIADSISDDHGKEVNPKDPKEGKKEYYKELPKMEKKIEASEDDGDDLEKKIKKLLAEGMSEEEIAYELNVDLIDVQETLGIETVDDESRSYGPRAKYHRNESASGK